MSRVSGEESALADMVARFILIYTIGKYILSFLSHFSFLFYKLIVLVIKCILIQSRSFKGTIGLCLLGSLT